MAKVYKAPFAQNPKSWTAVAVNAVALTGANSLADNTPANTVLLGTADAEGGLVSSISAIPRATVAATALFIWSSLNNGQTKQLIASATMPVTAVSATAETARTVFKHADGTVISESAPLRLQAGEQIYCGIGVTVVSGIVFSMRHSDF